MKSLLQFGKAVLTLAILLATTAGAWAQLNWSGTQNLTDGQNITQNITLTGNVTINVPSGGTATISGKISGNYKITKTGASILVLKNAQHTGATEIQAGYIEFNGANDVPTSAIVATSGVVFNIPSGSTVQYTGVISSTGYLEVAGAGKLILTGANTYAGPTYIDGILQVGNGTSGSIASTIFANTLNANATLRFQPGADMTFNKVISGPGKVEYKGTGTKYLRLTADNTYTGTTTIEEEGILFLGDNTTTGSVAGNIVNNGVLYFNHSNSHTYSGVISGAGYVYYNSAGKTTLNGANTYTGISRVLYSTLTLGAGGSIAQSSEVLLNNDNSKFDISAGNKSINRLNSSSANAEVILGSRQLTVAEGTYAGKITGTGSLVKNTSNVLTLTGAYSYTGTTAVTGGWLSFGGSTGNITGNIAVSAGATLYFNRSNDYTYSGVISGAGDVSHSSDKILILKGANTYTGKTSVLWGFLSLEPGGSINSTSEVALTLAAAEIVFDISSNLTFSKPITGLGNVQKVGTGTLTLTQPQYKGHTAITNGAIHFQSETLPTSTINFYSSANNPSVYILVPSGAKLEYGGVIQSSGNVIKTGSGKLILSGENTYTGSTTVNAGTLQIGNGTSGSIASTSKVVLDYAANILRFEPGGNMSFDKVISGAGKVECKGSSSKHFMLTANNTYTGGTINEPGSYLYISNNSGSGSVAGNIVNNGLLIFYRLNDYTFSGVISGTGSVTKYGAGTLTLDGANTYTGATNVGAGTLALGANGTIAQSLEVTMLASGAKFNISAGNKTIKSLRSAYTGSEIILGASTLQIGTSSSSDDGGGIFGGKFTGTGGVAKTGTKTFTLSGANTATGPFGHSVGTVEFSGTWAGNYARNGGTAIMDVKGTGNIGGNLSLSGGTINMDLTSSPPSKINVAGSVSASGTTTINLTATAGTYTLIQAASGLSSTTPFAFNLPGLTLTPQATGTQLNLTVGGASDNTPPTVGTALRASATPLADEIGIGCGAATDNVTAAANLVYYAYRSLSNNIATVANCEANGTLIGQKTSGGASNIGFAVTGLTPNTLYYFNVVVKDEAGNKSAYTSVSQTTAKASLTGTPTVSGNLVFGQTLTAGVTGLSSTPSIAALGTVTYQWQRRTSSTSTNIGANSATYTLTAADIGYRIQVSVTTSNTQGSVSSTIAGAPVVTKATQTAPAAPTLSSKTHNSITLNTIAGAEYRLSSGTWQPSPVFGSLTPQTNYTFHARMAETATHLASPESPASAAITTNAAPPTDMIYQGIQAPSAINAPYNAPKTAAGLGLPQAVTINTDQGSQPGVAITWNVAAANYTVGADAQQTFTVAGTVALPAGVVNPNGVSLSTQVTVTVAARPVNPQITSISVTPATVTVRKGQTQQFTANVQAVDGATTAVTWSVSGNGSAGTSINQSGWLTVAANESASTLTVRATSDFNSAMSGTATVTVSSVGNENISPAAISLYPNPFANRVQLSGAEGHQLKVFDMTGRTVYSAVITSPEEKISLDRLPKGIYLFQLIKDGKALTLKGVKR
jgi:autotransporter-associated beta strand protein